MWVDGYWNGKMVNGYPATYFSNGHFEYPWEKNVEKKSDTEQLHLTPAKQCDIVLKNKEK